MMQKGIQGPRSRQPLSSSEFRNNRLAAWLHDTGSSWNAAQSSETQGPLHAHSFPSLIPPGSPLLSSSTTASSCVSDCSPQSRIPVPQPLGLSDPASLTGDTSRSTALLVGTGTWFATLSSRPKQGPEACCPGSPPRLRPERPLNASFREILFNNTEYAERLNRIIQDLPSEDRSILLDQSFDSIASLGGGASPTQHNADSRWDYGGVTPAIQKPTPSPATSNKRKAPPGGNQQDRKVTGKAPDDSHGSRPEGGPTGGHHQNKKSKTCEFLYLCPYRQAYHPMSPQHKFRSCQPPGHIKDRSHFKKHLKEVHVRTPVGQSSDAGFNPDYSMDEDLWNNKVVGIFDKAQSKRFKRGSEPWQQNERAFYQKIWKTILPNVQPMPASPFYNDSVNGHPLIDVARRILEVVFKEKADRAVQNGQVASAEDYRPSQEEAMDMMAVPLATILNTMPELPLRVNDLSRSQADSDHLPPLTEDTRSLTPATSSLDHVPSISQDLLPQTTAALHPPEITHQTPFTDMDADQQCRAFPEMMENIQPETPSMVFLETPPNNNPTRLQPARTASKNQVYIHVDIEPPSFEVTLAGCKAPNYIGPQQWNIPVPAGLMVMVKPRQMERPTNNGGPAMSVNLETGVSSFNSQLQSTGDSSFVWEDGCSELLKDYPPDLFGEAHGACSDEYSRQNK